MSDFVNTVDIVGDEALTDSIIEKTITEIFDDICTSIGEYAFYECKSLTSVDFPLVTTIGGYSFQNSSILSSVNFPRATTIGNYAFSSAAALTSINFPLATSLGVSSFSGVSLANADFPLVTSLGRDVFYFCGKLTALILRNTATVCTLANSNAFKYTPIADGTGYIYVPSTLLADYQAATNWSTYAAQFRALEDYTVDGTTTGELDPDKI